MHEWLLSGWGMPIGEIFDLERLSVECRRLGKWSFFFSSMPLNVSRLVFGWEMKWLLMLCLGSWRSGESAEWCCYSVRMLISSCG